VIEPVCAALVAAHAAGVIPRDVKASNIMVGGAGAKQVKLLDFGIAKLIGPPDTPGSHVSLTTEGRQVGTLTIMAPEQLLGGPVDGRIDIYALGVLIYRLLTGRLPFDGKNALTLAEQHMNAPPPRPSQRAPLSPAIDTVVLRCLEKRPERRYRSVDELCDALHAAVLGGRGGARVEGGPALGVGVYLEVLMPPDDIDDALGDDISAILDLAEDELGEAGYTIAFTTGNSVLGVRVLPDDPAESVRARGAALAHALALHASIAARPGADPRAHPKICVHVDGLTLRSGAQVTVTGGALVNANAWAPLGDTDAVCATERAADGVTGFDLTPIAPPTSGEGLKKARPALVSVAPHLES
jgi:serine/threonine-protein kinase